MTPRLIAGIRAIRKTPLRQLAMMTGLSVATLWRIENGQAKPTEDDLASIAQALAVDVGLLRKAVAPPEAREGVAR